VASFQVDVDLIFSSLGGRLLLLVSEKGTIVKANIDTLELAGLSSMDDIEGKKWDNIFSHVGHGAFRFSDLTDASTGFISVWLNDQGGSQSLYEIRVDTIFLEGENAGKYFIITGTRQPKVSHEDMLFQVMKGTEKDFGEDFILSVTKALAKTLKVDFAFIGKLFKGEKDRVETLSFWGKKKYKDSFQYDLAGSPCENFVDHSQQLIPRNVAKLYPKDNSLSKLGVESYFSTPIYYSNGEALGLLVIMDSKPMEENSASSYILNIFASRIGAEIEWAETQKALQDKDRKLSSLIDSIPHPIFFKDKEGRYEGINRAFEEVLNTKESLILGKKSINKSKTSGAKYDKDLLSKPGKRVYDAVLELGEGNQRKYLMTKSTIVDDKGNIEGLVGSAVDITDLRAAESELKASEERYRSLFSTANDAIFMMSADIFIDCNKKTLKMFNCTRDDIIGHPPYEFSPEYQPDGRASEEKAMEKINQALAGKPQKFYWKHKQKTGSEFDAEVSLNAFNIDGKPFIQAIVRDVTDNLQLSESIETQNARMEEMYKLISATDISFEKQLSNLLELATKSLGMDTGMLGKIENDKYTILDYYTNTDGLKKGTIYELENTYCTLTYSQDRLVAIPNMSTSEYNDHPCHNLFNMEAYIGAPFWVRGKRYGTLSFMAKAAVDNFRAIDFDFVQMIAQWIGSAMERVQYEENLVARDALLGTMLREIPIDFSVRDANLKMVVQSDLSKKYWGNNEGKPIDYSDIDDKSKIKWKKIFSEALKGEVVKGEDNIKIYGEQYDFYSIASPVIVNGKVTEIMVINIDISKLKESEEKLTEQNELLTKLNSELDRFVYSASHDLRAPLASMLGLIDLTSREMNSPSTTHYLELMSKSVNTMDRFIAEITEYSRNLRLEAISNLIDFKKLFSESFEHVKFMLPGPARSSIKIKGKGPFYSDYERLKMVVNNLISNSIRYKGYGRDPELKFIIKINKKHAEIDVIDNGMGIDEKHINKVFDMFYRASDKNVGSGLGLFIVKETIEKLNGEISISSKLNEGTSVHIKLPNLIKESTTS